MLVISFGLRSCIYALLFSLKKLTRGQTSHYTDRLAKSWAGLGATAQGHWKTQYTALSISGINSYVKFNAARFRINLGFFTDPTNTPAAAEAVPTVNVATAATKSVNLTWTDSAGANDKATAIYMSITNAFTPDISNLVKIVAHGVQAASIIKLNTGTPYYFRLRGLAADAVYEVTNLDTGEAISVSGDRLMGEGLPVHVTGQPDSALLAYRRVT
jgi:hypothetical protein